MQQTYEVLKKWKVNSLRPVNHQTLTNLNMFHLLTRRQMRESAENKEEYFDEQGICNNYYVTNLKISDSLVLVCCDTKQGGLCSKLSNISI